MATDFWKKVEQLLPGTITWKTERTKTIYVQFPDGSRRTFTRQPEALAYVRDYAKHQGHPTPPAMTDPYLLELVAAIKDSL